MLQVEQAIDSILSRITPLSDEDVLLHQADGRFLAQPFVAPFALPTFDNSAMDGYAVRSIDLSATSTEHPVLLQVVDHVAAGDGRAVSIGAGQCVRLFTGSPLPIGADAVIMQEDTESRPDGRIACLDRVRPWENVRFRGEDIREGSSVMERGDRLNFSRLGLLAAFGCEKVRVTTRPRVALLATGCELKEPGQPLKAGEIFESNRLMLATFFRSIGVEIFQFPLVPDSREATRSALEEAFTKADVVITTGGVSVGEHDHVKSAWEELGGKMEWWKVAMKPGKPFVFGTRGSQLFFGLPGNPVSALVTALVLVRPGLLKMAGARDTSPRTIMATLGEPLANRGDRRHFMRVQLAAAGEVISSGIQASHVLRSLANADGLVDVPASTSLAKGTHVPVQLFC